jgi:hypothetical protein
MKAIGDLHAHLQGPGDLISPLWIHQLTADAFQTTHDQVGIEPTTSGAGAAPIVTEACPAPGKILAADSKFTPGIAAAGGCFRICGRGSEDLRRPRNRQGTRLLIKIEPSSREQHAPWTRHGVVGHNADSAGKRSLSAPAASNIEQAEQRERQQPASS